MQWKVTSTGCTVSKTISANKVNVHGGGCLEFVDSDNKSIAMFSPQSWATVERVKEYSDGFDSVMKTLSNLHQAYYDNNGEYDTELSMLMLSYDTWLD